MILFNCQAFKLKKFFFGALAEALEVGAVGIEDKDHERATNGQEEFQLGSPSVAPDDHHRKNYGRH